MCDIDKYPAICQQLAKGTDEEWELRLFIEAAIINYIWLETLREQKIDFWKYENESNKIKTPEQMLFFLQSKLAVIEMIGNRFGTYFNNDLKQLLGTQTEDAQEVVSAAEKVMSFYRDLLDLKISLQFVDAIPSYRCIVKELYYVIESVCKTFDELYRKLLIAKGAFEKLLAGETEEENIQINFNVSLQIDADRLMDLVSTIL